MSFLAAIMRKLTSKIHPPRPAEPINVNMNVNLNVGGGLTVKVEQTPPPSPLAGVWLSVVSGGIKVKGRSPMAYTLPVGMMINVQINYVDARGNPAVVDGDTTWSSSDETIATVHVNADDSTHADIWSVDLGQAQITTHADADLGEGTKDIIGTLDIQVVAGEAVTAQIVPQGDAQPIPMAASASRSAKR